MDSAVMDPNKTPIMMPPEGVIPNFENPLSNAYISRAATLVFLPLMLVFLALRICSRIVVTHSFGIDDYIHVAAAASTVVFCGILLSCMLLALGGYLWNSFSLTFLVLDSPNGRHGWDVPISVLTDSYLQINFTFVLISAISIMMVKLSLLVMYLRLFKPVQLVKIIIYVCIGVVTCFYMATVIAELVVGIPRAGDSGWYAAQLRYGPVGLDVSSVRGVFGIVSDFGILFIPLSQVIKLNLPLKRKVTLICIFLTGLLACISSIMSCVYRFRERGDPDYTWANTMPNAFAVVEITVGHMCGSMPALPALITSLKKNERLLSILNYFRSSRNNEHQSDKPTLTPEETPDMSPRIPKGRLTKLRFVIQKLHRLMSPPKEPSLRIYRISEYDDLECTELEEDYHSNLRKENAAYMVAHQV